MAPFSLLISSKSILLGNRWPLRRRACRLNGNCWVVKNIGYRSEQDRIGIEESDPFELCQLPESELDKSILPMLFVCSKETRINRCRFPDDGAILLKLLSFTLFYILCDEDDEGNIIACLRVV